MTGRCGPYRTVDRQKRLIEFVAAWAEDQMRISNQGSEVKNLAVNNNPLEQMIARITDDLASSPDDQRRLAVQLALTEFSKSS